MSELQVTDIGIPELLKRLRKGEWLVPEFQREFVWAVADILDLTNSILKARPIGMATLWEQPDESELPLEPISVPDDVAGQSRKSRYFAPVGSRPAKVNAILDGKQRCTAIAMVFGGLRPQAHQYKFAGRFYLDVGTDDPAQRVIFIKDAEIRRRHLETDAACMSAGFFPLTSSVDGEDIMGQWLRYLQSIRSPQYYKEGTLPEEAELNRRDAVLKDCFQGLVDTRLAVYIVPPTYFLGDICDVFEKLNTTGTEVSTVDLIHSWLYADTARSSQSPILLRDWMNDLGDMEGAVGWASSKERPELVAQIITACYIAADIKSPPRRVGRNSPSSITSIKSGDLLSVPTDHWRQVVANTPLIAQFLNDFQLVVAGGNFPYTQCPYPAVAAIYVALRWHAHFDHVRLSVKPWGRTELDALFKAFFWRNALSNRYDQGFLSKLGTDLKELRALLGKRAHYDKLASWGASVGDELAAYIHDTPQVVLPTKAALIDELTDGRPVGATLKTFTLPMLAGVKTDLVNASLDLRYPKGEGVELHHIYPKGWCRSSQSGPLRSILDPGSAGRDFVESISNLMPLSRVSNNRWKIALPGQIIVEEALRYNQLAEKLVAVFIDSKCFQLLESGVDGIPEFWTRRADLIAQDLLNRTQVAF